jgi:hypothetical protein
MKSGNLNSWNPLGHFRPVKGLLLPCTGKCHSCCVKGMYSKCYLFIYFQGYFGCAVGKAKQSAKTEIENLKLSDITCKELLKEAARM